MGAPFQVSLQPGNQTLSLLISILLTCAEEPICNLAEHLCFSQLSEWEALSERSRCDWAGILERAQKALGPMSIVLLLKT